MRLFLEVSDASRDLDLLVFELKSGTPDGQTRRIMRPIGRTADISRHQGRKAVSRFSSLSRMLNVT